MKLPPSNRRDGALKRMNLREYKDRARRGAAIKISSRINKNESHTETQRRRELQKIRKYFSNPLWLRDSV